ncbi:DUF2280 domain-containing protein [Novosphingobium sp.]|uniref:DUF2280 domain-containing protein n=1 Tax=Novosphingobium sp. TaxID=1874826 RepID=UPI0035AF7A8E
MKRLAEPVKRRIIEHLACRCRAREVVDLIAEEFGVKITPRHVRAYDPTSLLCAIGSDWVSHFWAIRARFEADISSIAIANRAYRMKQLDYLFATAFSQGRNVQAARYLEQAAKEMGDCYQRSHRRQPIGE